MRALLAYVVAVAALVLNPFFACSAAEPVFTYGVADIEAALGGTWDATITRGAQRQTVKFRMEVATGEPGDKHSSLDLVKRAAACGHRTLVKSAHACLDDTRVPLRLIALDAGAPKLTGEFRVIGTHFDDGYARLRLGDVDVSATVSRSGKVTSVDMPDQVSVQLIHEL